ncbi:hypothetical protein JA1_003224 [Spathaspora sp. JA1]|nr:hypothetical protein JA1_003224 [Spathaspora sp. JA1]
MAQIYTTAPLDPLALSDMPLSSSESSSFFRSVDPSPKWSGRPFISNPFAQIYDPNFRSTNHGNVKYERIPQQESNPIVTVIEDPHGLRRNGSVVSHEMVLRNRKRIKLRNKLLQKEEKEDTKHKKKKNQSTKFRFPVKRTSSLKQKSMFSNKDELVRFVGSKNYRHLLLSLLPHQMRVFHHSQILKVYPKLTSELVQFKVPEQSRISRNRSRKIRPSLTDIVYSKYKREVFDLKCTIPPPKFEDLFPNDLTIIPKKAISRINKRLLLEILFRKTIEAKIEYRLKQVAVAFTQEQEDSSQSRNSSGSSDSGELSHHSQSASFTFEFSSSEQSSGGNSGNFHQHSALPSPNIRGSQITDKSQISSPTSPQSFHTAVNYERILRKSQVYKLQPRERSTSIVTDSTNQSGGQDTNSISTGSTSWSVVFGPQSKQSSHAQRFLESLRGRSLH